MADGNTPAPEDRHRATDAVWQPREQADVRQTVAEYSRWVARLKIALPVIAGVITLLVFILPQLRTESERFRIGLKNVTNVTNDAFSVVNGRFIGTDDNGEPFQVTAQSAHERPQPDENGVKLFDLNTLRADIDTTDGKHITLTATAGVYDRKNEVLDLSGQVDLIQGTDYEMHTTAARIRLKERIVTSDAPVSAKGPFGEITRANGFIARQNDHVLIFKGPATLVLEKNKQSDAAGATSGETQR